MTGSPEPRRPLHPVEPGAVAAVLDRERVASRRRLAVGSAIVLLCASHRDQLAARDRLAGLLPPNWTIRL